MLAGDDTATPLDRDQAGSRSTGIYSVKTYGEGLMARGAEVMGNRRRPVGARASLGTIDVGRVRVVDADVQVTDRRLVGGPESSSPTSTSRRWRWW